jgi:hypothetical protein
MLGVRAEFFLGCYVIRCGGLDPLYVDYFNFASEHLARFACLRSASRTNESDRAYRDVGDFCQAGIIRQRKAPGDSLAGWNGSLRARTSTALKMIFL